MRVPSTAPVAMGEIVDMMVNTAEPDDLESIEGAVARGGMR